MSDIDDAIVDATTAKTELPAVNRLERRLRRAESDVLNDSTEFEYVLDDRPSPLDQKEKLRRQQRLREPHLRRKMVLSRESTLPWEFDTARFASQRQSGAFGSIRNTVTSIHSSRDFSEGDPTVNPLLTTPPRRASQKGMKPFGMHRELVTHIVEHDNDEPISCNELHSDKKSETMLKLWDQPNPQAKNSQLYGVHRPTVVQSTGGRKWTSTELVKSRASIPRFHRVADTSAGRDRCREVSAVITGFSPRRQATTQVIGLDRTIDDQLNSNKHMSWLGSQLSLQTQSGTGGFGTFRDVAGLNYFERLQHERRLSREHIEYIRQREREEESLLTESVSSASTDLHQNSHQIGSAEKLSF